MDRVIDYNLTHPIIFSRTTRIANGEDGVVAGGGDIKDVPVIIVCQPGRADDKRCRIALMQIPRRDLSCRQHYDGIKNIVLVNRQLKPYHRAAQNVGNKKLGKIPLIIDRQIPRTVEKLCVAQGLYQVSVLIENYE